VEGLLEPQEVIGERQLQLAIDAVLLIEGLRDECLFEPTC